METDRARDGVKLLARNYQAGDFAKIDALLERTMTDFEVHSLGYAIHQIIEVELRPETENTLLWLYEHGPCSMCRTKVVKSLIALNRLPHWMRDEIRHDADSDTRKLA
jgi:hypothetical protein